MASNKYPFVSVIIPTWRARKVLEQCVESLLAVDYPKDKLEILLVSQEKLESGRDPRIQQIRTGIRVGYTEARNKGAEKSSGEILAFIDDDCVVPRTWLLKAVPFFANSGIALLGGPAVPFQGESFRYRAGGYLLSAPFVTGPVSSRYKTLSNAFETQGEHLILANTFVRRNAFQDVDGFVIDQAPCEDGYLYFRLREKGHKLLYAPEVFVWHRAKPIVFPLVSKIFYYALGRGGLTARNPRASNPAYFIPSLFFAVFVALFIFSFFSRVFFYLLAFLMLAYCVANGINALYAFFKFEKNPFVPLAFFLATPLLHLSYGVGVVWGLGGVLAGRAKGRDKNVEQGLGGDCIQDGASGREARIDF